MELFARQQYEVTTLVTSPLLCRSVSRFEAVSQRAMVSCTRWHPALKTVVRMLCSSTAFHTYYTSQLYLSTICTFFLHLFIPILPIEIGKSFLRKESQRMSFLAPETSFVVKLLPFLFRKIGANEIMILQIFLGFNLFQAVLRFERTVKR